MLLLINEILANFLIKTSVAIPRDRAWKTNLNVNMNRIHVNLIQIVKNGNNTEIKVFKIFRDNRLSVTLRKLRPTWMKLKNKRARFVCF